MGIVNMVLGVKKPVVLPTGVSHMTAASRHIHNLALGISSSRSTGTRRRKKKAAGVTKKRRRVAKSASAVSHHKKKAATGSKSHLVKGSAAAKKHMASLRKMRKAKAA